MDIVDYTDSFTQCIAAHGRNQGDLGECIILRKLDTPHKRFDGKRVSYEIEYRDLSQLVANPSDEAYVCVVYQEFTYWSKKELTDSGAFKKNMVNLFDCFFIL